MTKNHVTVQIINAVRPEFGFETMVLQVTAIVKNHVRFSLIRLSKKYEK